MAKISRFPGNVKAFASSASATLRTVFGGVTESDTLADNLNADYETGWEIVAPSAAPTKQDFNALGFAISQQVAYLMQAGVPEWHAAQEYHTDHLTNYGGAIFKSLVDDNVGNTPGASPTQWEPFYQFATQIEAEAGIATGVIMSPLRTAQAFETFIRPEWTSAYSVGSAAAFSAGVSSITALNGTDIAYCDDNAAGQLRAYRFNGSTFAQVGSALTIAGTAYPAITAMSATDVAFVDAVNDSLRCYRFNGSTWSLVGSGLSVANSAGQRGLSLTALNATDVAYSCADGTNIRLRCYRFNGSTWSLVGSELVIAGAAQQVAIAALNATDVAFIDSANDSLRCYRFNGSTWSLVGSGLSVYGNVPYLTSLNATDVALIDNARTLGTYRFDGSTFARVGSPVTIAGGAGQPAIAALGGGSLAYSYDGLQRYEIGRYYGSHVPYRPF